MMTILRTAFDVALVFFMLFNMAVLGAILLFLIEVLR